MYESPVACPLNSTPVDDRDGLLHTIEWLVRNTRESNGKWHSGISYDGFEPSWR